MKHMKDIFTLLVVTITLALCSCTSEASSLYQRPRLPSECGQSTPEGALTYAIETFARGDHTEIAAMLVDTEAALRAHKLPAPTKRSGKIVLWMDDAPKKAALQYFSESVATPFDGWSWREFWVAVHERMLVADDEQTTQQMARIKEFKLLGEADRSAFDKAISEARRESGDDWMICRVQTRAGAHETFTVRMRNQKWYVDPLVDFVPRVRGLR